MPLDLYIAYLATVAVFFASPPGPSQILMISSSLRHGVSRSRYTVAGDLSANVLQMLAAGLGLTALIGASDHALDVIKWLGVGYLVWMAIRTFRASPKSPSEGGARATRRRSLYLTAFMTSGSNPKAVFFFAALFPQFITAEAPLAPQLAVLGATYLVIDGAILFVYGALARRAFGRLARSGRALNRLSGTAMLAAAGLLALRDADAS